MQLQSLQQKSKTAQQTRGAGAPTNIFYARTFPLAGSASWAWYSAPSPQGLITDNEKASAACLITTKATVWPEPSGRIQPQGAIARSPTPSPRIFCTQALRNWQEGVGGGTQLLLAVGIRPLTIYHAPFSRWSTVPTLNRGLSNSWARSSFSYT